MAAGPLVPALPTDGAQDGPTILPASQELVWNSLMEGILLKTYQQVYEYFMMYVLLLQIVNIRKYFKRIGI